MSYLLCIFSSNISNIFECLLFMYINKFCKGLNHNIKESSDWCATGTQLLRVGTNVNKWNLKIHMYWKSKNRRILFQERLCWFWDLMMQLDRKLISDCLAHWNYSSRKCSHPFQVSFWLSKNFDLTFWRVLWLNNLWKV